MTDVFKEGSETAVVATVDQLVGDGKKFKSVEDLAKGKVEADQFIERLKSELDGLRSDLDRRVNVEKELDALRSEMVEAQKKVQAPRNDTSSQLTPDRIQQIVNDTITAAERNKTASQNVQDANSSVLSKFEGDLGKATDYVKAKAAELSMTVDDLKAIAARSPEAFRKIVLGDTPVDTTVNDTTVMKSTVSTERLALASPQVKAGSREYFDNLRKTDPKQYWKSSTQRAIFDAVKAGTYSL